MSVRDEDAGIVRAVQGGQTEAFRLLVDRHKGRLYTMIFKMVGDPAEAEELTEDTFAHAFQGLGGFRQEARFGTWLIQIGLHAVRDHIRRERRIRGHGLVSLETLAPGGEERGEFVDPHPLSNPLSQLEERETRERIRDALLRLPYEYQEVIVLKHLENRSYEEIAQLTKCSVGSLKVRAHRARRLLREELIASERSEVPPGLGIARFRKETPS
jgi:RNA polymerase sigma-70 factor (ECF subfamily)